VVTVHLVCIQTTNGSDKTVSLPLSSSLSSVATSSPEHQQPVSSSPVSDISCKHDENQPHTHNCCYITLHDIYRLKNVVPMR